MLAVYVVLYNTMTLWHTIGLIGNVMACYGRKSKFADVALHSLTTALLALGLWGQDIMCQHHVLVCLYSLRYLSSSVVDSITLTLRTVRIILYLLFCSS